ncbi:3-oxoacyl-ACP reductase FabG [Pseudovibrio sp. POLY-S9]|uniref:3-oxoacyl-ACP reductase FabG n=1 Tax=Pseudovibrio sp. POLY-S9 TaxID=1576596 RepID=UPI00070F1113|nr:3-oxoacyl-ACP reductase FabG [Pseudovibrio sp. POLY-S9]
MKLTNKWIFITGGSRGIGREIVVNAATQGYTVIFTYRNSHSQAHDLTQSLAAEGRSVIGYRCDAADFRSVKNLADHLVAELGAPYAIINNAGITQDSLFIYMKFDAWRNVLDNNLNSAFFVTQAFLPSMAAQKDGCIIFMSSVAAKIGNVGQSNYSASKAALIGLTQTVAQEVGRYNIRVNSIMPGLIDTEVTKKIPQKTLIDVIKRIPLKRLGTSKEIAASVSFLLGENAKYITGQSIIVDGGLTS